MWEGGDDPGGVRTEYGVMSAGGGALRLATFLKGSLMLKYIIEVGTKTQSENGFPKRSFRGRGRIRPTNRSWKMGTGGSHSCKASKTPQLFWV